jgi:predicted acyltransferase
VNPAALAALAHFLFIVGVSITLSRRTRWPAVLRRALVLVALGLFMAAFPAFRLETLRWPGVLQRIGVCYLAAWALQRRLRAPVLTLTGAVLLVGYWALLTRLPLPDGSPANLDPGMNLAAYFDRLWMSGHLWRQTKTWDPEGLLSTLPAVATTLISVLAGRCLAGATSPLRAVRRLGVAGVALTLAGLAWARSFPINKNLWTSSYVLLSGGLALVAFAACYWLIDVRGRRAWARPCVTFGVNAVFVFAASGLVAKLLGRIHVGAGSLQAALHTRLFASWLPPEPASLAYALANVLAWYAVLRAPERRGIYVKV